jgi:hypothetical protein
MREPKRNQFPDLGKDIGARFMAPIGSPSFWMYLFIGVLGIGGLAIWIELLKVCFGLGGTTSADGLRTAINTFFPAIGCGAALQLVTAEKQKPNLRAIGVAVGAILSGACLVALLLQIHHPWWSFGLGVTFSIVSLAMWWVANGIDQAYQEQVPDNVALGGPVNQPLAGSLAGYTT